MPAETPALHSTIDTSNWEVLKEARKLANTNFFVNSRFRPNSVRAGRLVTGQQQYSGAATARLVIEALGR